MDSVRGIFLSPIHRLLQQVYIPRFIEKIERVTRTIFLRLLENLLIIRIRRIESFLLRIYIHSDTHMHWRIHKSKKYTGAHTRARPRTHTHTHTTDTRARANTPYGRTNGWSRKKRKRKGKGNGKRKRKKENKKIRVGGETEGQVHTENIYKYICKHVGHMYELSWSLKSNLWYS